MTRDLVYYASKKPYTYNSNTYFKLNELGEIQQDFNISNTLDGTKDSAHFQIISYSKIKLEPNTIIKHANTNTWWVVSHDKVIRYTNESGFMYLHEVDCLGAIELLNARDLTDCGFRSNKYTIDNFAKRLVKLSNFEIKLNSIIYKDVEPNSIVDYIKTFENYTLLSALREFFDGYNCGIKLNFNTTLILGEEYIATADLIAIPKCGYSNNTDTPILNIDSFVDTRETTNIDKKSFGSIVVTNAQNVVSTKTKTFPSSGAYCKLSADERTITRNNAILRLPTNVYKVNWLKMIAPITLSVSYYFTGGSSGNTTFDITFFDDESIKNTLINNIVTVDMPTPIKERFLNDLDTTLVNDVKKAMSAVFYNNDKLDSISGNFESLPNVSQPRLKVFASGDTYTGDVVLAPKEIKDCATKTFQAIAWERGKDYLSGFNFLATINEVESTYLDITSTLYSSDGIPLYDILVSGSSLTINISHSTYYPYGSKSLNTSNVGFVVNYIPMSDLKIKTNNDNLDNDIQLYNQSGKLTDSVALSKLINSYSLEIKEKSITRYSQYYIKENIPKVGQLVNDNGDIYVINNISQDFLLNEESTNNFPYKVECEVSMSKAVAVKSLMVNANSNIRDYGIPQTNNIARKQIYKDVWSFTYEQDENSVFNNSYLPLEKFFDGSTKQSMFEYTTLVRTIFNNDDVWFYQVPATRFELKKQIIYNVNFKDNNIIGYDMQSQFSGFDITRIINGWYDNINTPISYVDDNGEIEDITLIFCTDKQLYENYSNNLISQHMFIDSTTFLNAINNVNYDFMLLINDYKKDALEIPVFEYSCQLINTNDVLVGENILEYYEPAPNISNHNFFVFYGFSYSNANKINEQNALSFDMVYYDFETVDGHLVINIDDFAYLENFNTQTPMILLYNSCVYDTQTNMPITGTQKVVEANKDYAIYRFIVDLDTQTLVKKDLAFVFKNTKEDYINANQLHCYVNHYKR